MAQKDIVLTLVHGTWAQRAPWINASSPLYQQLQEKTPRLREIFAYSWSGRNSHRARLVAAADLIEHERQVRSKYPAARHYVIAHSHGGNVALYACENREFRRNIAGIACLSTPFILSRSESPESEGLDEHFVMLGYVVALVFISFIVGSLALAWLEASKLHFAVRLLIYAGVFILLMPLIAAVNRVIRFVWGPPDYSDYMYYARNSFFKDLERDLNLLIIRSTGDEATATLAAMRFANWLMGKVASVLYPIVLLPTRIFWPVRNMARDEKVAFGILIGLDIVALIGGALWAVVSMIGLWSLSMPDPILYLSRSRMLNSLTTLSSVSVTAWPVMLFTAPVLIAGMLAVLLAFVTSLCRVPFGFYSGLDLMADQLTVEITPPGRWIVHHLRDQPWGRGGLAHSDAYSQPEAIALIVEWLSSPRRKVYLPKGRV